MPMPSPHQPDSEDDDDCDPAFNKIFSNEHIMEYKWFLKRQFQSEQTGVSGAKNVGDGRS